MKNTLITATAISILAISANAGDFDNNQFFLSTSVNDFELNVEAVENEISEAELGVYVFPHRYGSVEAVTFLSVGHDFLTDDSFVTASYMGTMSLTENTAVWGLLEGRYEARVRDISDGELYATPEMGISYAVTNSFSVFGSGNYTWHVNDDWKRQGGELEVGGVYAFTDNLDGAVSLVQDFDTGNDDTNLRAGAYFRF